MIGEAYLTTREAADRLRLVESRVCQLLRAGELRGEKAGQTVWMVPLSEIERFERQRKPRKPYTRRNHNG